jgi:hypothetical protein
MIGSGVWAAVCSPGTEAIKHRMKQYSAFIANSLMFQMLEHKKQFRLTI